MDRYFAPSNPSIYTPIITLATSTSDTHKNQSRKWCSWIISGMMWWPGRSRSAASNTSRRSTPSPWTSKVHTICCVWSYFIFWGINLWYDMMKLSDIGVEGSSKYQRSLSMPASPVTPGTPSPTAVRKDNVWRSVFHPGSNIATKTVGANYFDRPEPNSPTVYDWWSLPHLLFCFFKFFWF